MAWATGSCHDDEVNISKAETWGTIGVERIPAMPHSPPPRTVLVVDDSPQMAVNLEIALTSENEYEVRVVGSAREALALLGQDGCQVSAIITDLEMPRMTGYELIEALRGNPRWATTPIIVSSGTADPDAPARAQRLGANAYFAKPYSPAKLRKTLSALLEASLS
jgi:two-component system, chemotaxis family, chemotaxis protein CheY